MFFLLIDGPGMLSRIFSYLPLRADDEQQMKERFVSVTRASIKGTVIIGIAQGGLSGIAFWAVGIPNVMFWTIVMVALSILPLVGGALVWVPACLLLLAMGEVWRALILAIFCALIVGSVDNVLRPWLVGRDTKMHDLMILFSTLGGLIVFGPLGFIIGPLVAGVFVTTWEIFGATYHDELEDGVTVMPIAVAAVVTPEPPVEPVSSAEIP
jgi:predicted PurR-regulated permease PerM